MNVSRYFALLPAAGVGSRMAAGTPKQYLPVAGLPMLARSAGVFTRCARIAHTFVVVGADDGYADDVLAALPVSVLRCGGASRHASVLNGLKTMREHVRDHDWVLVHDAARPGLTVALIDTLIDAVGEHAVGGLLALPVVDTVKRAGTGSVLTVARNGLWLAQTPQMFRFGALLHALQHAPAGVDITDEASAIEAQGAAPLLVEGHPRNLKVTLPRDLATMEMYLQHDDA
ncbi:MAG TPA: 2-C-methyl-D-erythritol 4-phosphate cytidylyltransferase [Burkholderiaceae bacterium]